MDELLTLLTQQEFAQLRGCTVRTLEREPQHGTGARFIKFGRAVRYRLRDVLEFIDQRSRQSTSETDPVDRGSREPRRPQGSSASRIIRRGADPPNAQAAPAE